MESKYKYRFTERLAKAKKTYGITEEQYFFLLEIQNHSCAICKKPHNEMVREIHIDHCHNSGKIRGLLCNDCNNGLGKLKDSVNLINKAIHYLEKHK